MRFSRLAARGARSDTCSADICSLRLLAHFQSEHPRLDCLLAREERVNGSKFTLGHPLRWISPDDQRSTREGSAQTRRFLPRMLGIDRTSRAASQLRARPGVSHRQIVPRNRRGRFHPVAVKHSGLSRPTARSIVRGSRQVETLRWLTSRRSAGSAPPHDASSLPTPRPVSPGLVVVR